MNKRFLIMVILSVGIFNGVSFAQDSVHEKQQYHLFNPVPKELMREVSTDRPDRTESAYTVDAGHYQLEMSFVDYTYDHRNSGGEKFDSVSLIPFNLKAGLLNNVDLQLLADPCIKERVKDDSGSERKRGIGDLQTRLKINVWGNDGGRTAFAAMPFVKFPTNSDDLGNGTVEGGIILPLAIGLPGGWGMGLMTEFDFNEDPDDEDRYITDYVNSITFSHAIAGDLNGYIEFFSNITDGNRSEWVGTVDTGLTYKLSPDIQMDAGINIGVTKSAEDLNPFCGIAVRY